MKQMPIGDDTKELLTEIAKSNPFELTSALRRAGCFVYLLTPEDIKDYHEDGHAEDGEANFTIDEIKEATDSGQWALADCVSMGDICDAVLNTARTNREEKSNG
jgi:hypothetical protein